MLRGDWAEADNDPDELSCDNYHPATFVIVGYLRTMQVFSRENDEYIGKIQSGKHISFRSEPTDLATEHTKFGVLLALRRLGVDIEGIEVTLGGP
jgi:hypothetical protein